MKGSLILLTLLVGLTLSKELGFPGEEKVITHLAQKLTHRECWILGNYLAQKAPKPSHAQAKMAKVGGHAKDFDCVAGLNLWASTLIPAKIQKKDKELYTKKELYQALAFAGRKDLRDWLKDFNFERSDEPQPEAVTGTPTESEAIASPFGPEGRAMDGLDPDLGDHKPLYEAFGPNLDNFPLPPASEKARKLRRGKQISGKIAGEDSTNTDEPKTSGKVIKWIVLSVIGFVSICLTLAIACSCRRKAGNAVGDDEEARSGEFSPRNTASVICGTGDSPNGDEKTPKDSVTPSSQVSPIETGDQYNANLFKANNSLKTA